MEFVDSLAVWRRVAGARETPPLPEQLREMISDERTAAAAYASLTRFCTAADAFRDISREERCHARRLAALYFLLTGQTPCAERGALPRETSYCAALRACFAAEQESARRYLAAAEAWPEHAPLFRALAAQEQAHTQRLLRLAQRVL